MKNNDIINNEARLPFIQTLELIMSNHMLDGVHKNSVVTFPDLLFYKYVVTIALQHEFGNEVSLPSIYVKTGFVDNEERDRTSQTVRFYNFQQYSSYYSRYNSRGEIFMPDKEYVDAAFNQLMAIKASTPGAEIYGGTLQNEARIRLMGDNYEDLDSSLTEEDLKAIYGLEYHRFWKDRPVINPKTGTLEKFSEHAGEIYDYTLNAVVDSIIEAAPYLDRRRVQNAVANSVIAFESFRFLDLNLDFTKKLDSEAKKERGVSSGLTQVESQYELEFD